MANTKNEVIFQFFKDLDIPIYVKLSKDEFGSDVSNLLSSLGFTELLAESNDVAVQRVKEEPHSRLLNLSLASPSVSRQIGMVVESDRFGKESLVPKTGYKVYRFKDQALLVFSLAAREWQMGVYETFGSDLESIDYKIILNRFLSWALAPLGIVGFWGIPVEEGSVLLKQGKAQGECVFFDLVRSQIFSEEGLKSLRQNSWIIKLDESLKTENRKMSGDDFYTALSTHCSYFEYENFPVHVRQLLKTLCQKVTGMTYSSDKFKPRTDLAL